MSSPAEVIKKHHVSRPRGPNRYSRFCGDKLKRRPAGRSVKDVLKEAAQEYNLIKDTVGHPSASTSAPAPPTSREAAILYFKRQIQIMCDGLTELGVFAGAVIMEPGCNPAIAGSKAAQHYLTNFPGLLSGLTDMSAVEANNARSSLQAAIRTKLNSLWQQSGRRGRFPYLRLGKDVFLDGLEDMAISSIGRLGKRRLQTALERFESGAVKLRVSPPTDSADDTAEFPLRVSDSADADSADDTAEFPLRVSLELINN